MTSNTLRLKVTVAVVAVAIGAALIGATPGSAGSLAPPTGEGRSRSGIAALTTLVEERVAEANRTGDPLLYGEAGTALAKAEAVAPRDVRTRLAAGVLHLALHEFTSARKDGERALRMQPDLPAAMAIVIDARIELGDYDGAVAMLERLVRQRPDDTALARVSYVRELHGDIASAISTMEKAVEAAAARPARRAVLRSYLGDLLLTDGDITAARAQYNQALVEVPGFVSPQIGIIRCLVATGDVAGARQKAIELADRAPVPAVTMLLGDIERLRGNTAGASDADALVRAHSAVQAGAGIDVDLETAVFEADRGRTSEALEAARNAYRSRKTVFTADALGWALTKAGRARDARRYVEKSLVLGSSSPSVRVHAAAAFAASGDRERARHELMRAFEHAPWLTIGIISEATAVARGVGVDVPRSWRIQ